LRPDNCTFDEYQAWFQDECDAIVLRPGFSVVDPKISAVNDPSPPWSMWFAIVYNDETYIRIFEHYRELSRKEGGGGRIQWFSYHYGPCSADRDDDGFPNKEDECVLRIDIDLKSKRHAHFAGENHIPESRLLGLDFDKITPFDFIRAVEKHRQTQKPLPELLGFEVSATK
jgi:hypothetical protein